MRDSSPDQSAGSETPNSTDPKDQSSVEALDEYALRTESRINTQGLRCCKGKVADITGSGMRILVSPKNLPQVGDMQEYTFSDQTCEIVVAGTVKWIRKGTAFTRRCEVGVEFSDIDPVTRDAIIKLAVQGELGLTKDGDIKVGYPDLYKILGVTPYAKIEEIEKAYRKEAKLWHPDHNSAPDAAQCFDKIRKAYSVLSDAPMRVKYDERFFNKDQQVA